MAGLLAGAMQGLGQGMATVAEGALEEKRIARLEELRNRHQVAREQRQNQREDRIRGEDRQWSLEDYDLQRQHAVEDRDVQFEQKRGLLQMQEAGANRRAGMQIAARQAEGRNDWQMMPTQDGRYIQYSPSRNEYRDANLPEGVSTGGDALTDRQKRELDFIEDEIKSIRESSTDEMGMAREPTEAETQHLQSLLSQRQAIMGGGARRPAGGEPTILETLMAGEGGESSDDAPPAAEPAAPSGSAPPRPGTAGGYIDSRNQRDANSQAEAQADDEVQTLAADARRIAGRISNPLQNAGGFQRGGLMSIPQSGGIDTHVERENARPILRQVSEAYDAETDPRRKAQLQRALDALYEAGVTP